MKRIFLGEQMKKKCIISGIVVVLLVFALMISYFLRPVSVFQVKHRLSKDSEWKDGVKEVKLEELNEKMGVQLFVVKTEYQDNYFLVSHWDDIHLFGSSFNEGDFFCRDIDKDGEYELFYMIYNPVAGMPYPMIFTYGVRDGMFVLESAFEFIGFQSHYGKMCSDEKGKFYIRHEKDAKKSYKYDTEYDTEYDMEFRYEEDCWRCYGDHADEINVIDVTKQYLGENYQSSLKDI